MLLYNNRGFNRPVNSPCWCCDTNAVVYFSTMSLGAQETSNPACLTAVSFVKQRADLLYLVHLQSHHHHYLVGLRNFIAMSSKNAT